MENTIDLLLTRRSVSAKNMQGPGPNPEQLQQILAAAHRVPDHGKLGPWRFVVFQGDAREAFGIELQKIFAAENPEAKDKLIAFQAQQLLRAPLVIAVISSVDKDHKVPEWEQVLSAGASCQNILVAANALGFGAQWLSEWYSYNNQVKALLGASSEDQIAGFIYIGSYEEKPEERVRPSLDERIRYWGKD